MAKYPDRHVLFVCKGNLNRSRAAEDVMGQVIGGTPDLEYDMQVRSAGIDPVGDGKPLTDEVVAWADAIYVFEGWHEKIVLGRYPDAAGKICNLQIPDVYDRNNPELILILRYILPELL